MADKSQMLEQFGEMTPVAGTVDVSIPIDILWDCFAHADQWSSWNACMFWVRNPDLVLGQELHWVFEPIRWWYIYKLPARATVVELKTKHKVTWEVTFIPGFYARHTYSMEDLDDGRTRFGSSEKALGLTFRFLRPLWLAHFTFVRDQSLAGAQQLERIYQQTGNLSLDSLPAKDYARSFLPFAVLLAFLAVLRRQ